MTDDMVLEQVSSWLHERYISTGDAEYLRAYDAVEREVDALRDAEDRVACLAVELRESQESLKQMMGDMTEGMAVLRDCVSLLERAQALSAYRTVGLPPGQQRGE